MVVSQAKIGDRVQIPGALAPLGVPPSAAEIRSITPEKIFEIVVYAVLPINLVHFTAVLRSCAFLNTLTMGAAQLKRNVTLTAMITGGRLVMTAANPTRDAITNIHPPTSSKYVAAPTMCVTSTVLTKKIRV